MRNTGEGAKPPLRYSLNLSAHFRVWVTVWVRRLTHILTHTIFSVFATKKHRKPKFSMLFGAAGQIRTADLILTKRPKHILRSTHSSLYVSCNPCAARVFWHVISWLVPFCPLRFYLIPAVCWKNVGKQMFCTLDYRPIKIGAVPRRTTDHIRRSHGPTGRDKIPRSFSP